MEKVEIKCPKCDKLLAKMCRYGSCKNMFLYCRSCKKEYQITIKETKKEKDNRANEPN